MENYRITKLNDYQYNDKSKFQNNDYEYRNNTKPDELFLEDLKQTEKWREYRNEEAVIWNDKNPESTLSYIYDKDRKETTYYDKQGRPQYKVGEHGITARYEYKVDEYGNLPYKTYHYNEKAELVTCIEHDKNGEITNIIHY